MKAINRFGFGLILSGLFIQQIPMMADAYGRISTIQNYSAIFLMASFFVTVGLVLCIYE